MSGEPRYVTDDLGQVGCLDCGSLVIDQAAHTRFHSILSGHAWALAVLSTAHLGASVHDRYEVTEKIRSKRFDSWTNDALADVMAAHADGDQ